jgi:ankyrin repeat protein
MTIDSWNLLLQNCEKFKSSLDREEKKEAFDYQLLKIVNEVLEDQKNPQHSKLSNFIIELDTHQHQLEGRSHEIAEIVHAIQQNWEIVRLREVLKNSWEDQTISPQELERLKKAVCSFDPHHLNEILPICASSPNPSIRNLALACLDCGADPNAKTDEGIPLLLFASSYGDSELAEALLTKGADPTKEFESSTIYDYLEFSHTSLPSLKIMISLLQRGIDLNQNFNGNPLWTSILKMITFNPMIKSPHSIEKKLLSSLFIQQLENISNINHKINNDLTALQIVAKQKDRALFLKLVVNGAKIEGSQSELQMIDSICEEILKNKSTSVENFSFVLELISQNYLPVFIKNTVFILEYLKFASDNSEIASRMHLSSKAILMLEDLTRFYILRNSETSLTQTIDLDRKLLSILSELSEEGFKAAERFQQAVHGSLEKNLQKEKEALRCIASFESNPTNLEKFTPLEKKGSQNVAIDMEDIVSVCMKYGKYSLIPEITLKPFSYSHTLYSRLLFLFVLDKLWLGPTDETRLFEGSSAEFTTSLIAKTIKKITQDLADQNSFLSPTMNQFSNRFLDTLNVAARKKTRNSRELAERVTHISEKSPIWIPSGSGDHATGLLLELMENGKIKMTLYNTGLDANVFHAQWEKEEKWQLFYIIEGVPLEDLSNPEIWQEFFLTCGQAEDMTSVYAFIREKLGKNGTIPSPSKDKIMYSALQFYGTCSAQHLIAFFEHQIKLLAPGTSEEKKATLNALKAELFSAMLNPHLESLHNKIQAVATERFEKYSVIKRLSSIASQPEEFNLLFSDALHVLEQLGEIELVKVLKEKNLDTTASKFFTLKLCLRQIYQNWANHPEQFEKLGSSNAVVLALDLAKSNALNEKRVIAFLDELYSKNDSKKLEELLMKLEISHYHYLANGWIDEKIRANPSENALSDCDRLLRSL